MQLRSKGNPAQATNTLCVLELTSGCDCAPQGFRILIPNECCHAGEKHLEVNNLWKQTPHLLVPFHRRAAERVFETLKALSCEAQKEKIEPFKLNQQKISFRCIRNRSMKTYWWEGTLASEALKKIAVHLCEKEPPRMFDCCGTGHLAIETPTLPSKIGLVR